jgi:hypothetical protein
MIGRIERFEDFAAWQQARLLPAAINHTLPDDVSGYLARTPRMMLLHMAESRAHLAAALSSQAPPAAARRGDLA